MSSRGSRRAHADRAKRLLVTLIAVLALLVGTAAPAAAVSAAATGSASVAAAGPVKSTLAGFNAGNIISDAVFTDESTMTEAQIQAFFDAKVTTCRGGSDKYGPIVCLKDFRTDSVNRPADAYCKGYTGAKGESAARIIFRVSQSCDINPRVLIVMLQKEQGLVTHTWPSAWRYDAALGQGCPDDAPCNPDYVGFFFQIYGAARQMQMYMEGRYFTWYAPGKTWNILYHPNRACGTSPVFVANKATSALYYYTPYQPNAAAMRAGYGTGDSCSSYGNRNFYNYFTDWFGSTQTATPPKPPVVAPTLDSMNSTNYVVGLDGAGRIWGYPYSTSTWGARVQLGTAPAGATTLVSLGDFDGDGHRDFVTTDKSMRLSLLRGDGATSLAAAQPLPGDWAGVTSVFAAGDFNGDGAADLFTTNANGELFLRAGTGAGGFRPPVRVGSGWQNISLVSGGLDLTGDDKPDVVARDAAGALLLYPGDGRGGWGAGKQIGRGWSAMTAVFSPGDFDGDGVADILAHAADGVLLLYRGTGQGNIAGVGPVGSGWAVFVSASGAGMALPGPRVQLGGFGNIDGVEGNDVVAVSTAGDAFIYPGNGAGGWRERSTLASGWGASDKVFPLGDFTGDRHRDLGRIDAAGRFLLYAGKAEGGFAPPVQIGQGWQGFTHVVGGFDFDGDRRTDVAVIAADGRMLLYRGNGQGQWSAGGLQIGRGWTIATQIFHAGDFDGDGRNELVVTLADGILRSYPLTGDGGFGASSDIGRGWDMYDTVFSPGDFTGDGMSDIVATDPDGIMYLYAGAGAGKMKARAPIGSGWSVMSTVG